MKNTKSVNVDIWNTIKHFVPSLLCVIIFLVVLNYIPKKVIKKPKPLHDPCVVYGCTCFKNK